MGGGLVVLLAVLSFTWGSALCGTSYKQFKNNLIYFFSTKLFKK